MYVYVWLCVWVCECEKKMSERQKVLRKIKRKTNCTNLNEILFESVRLKCEFQEVGRASCSNICKIQYEAKEMLREKKVNTEFNWFKRNEKSEIQRPPKKNRDEHKKKDRKIIKSQFCLHLI